MDIYYVRNNIKTLRKEKGITQKEIAARLYMDERTYARIERGEKKSMDLLLLSSIADLLETTVTDLLAPRIAGAGLGENLLTDHMDQLRQNQAKMLQHMKGLEEKLNRLLDVQSAAMELIKAATA